MWMSDADAPQSLRDRLAGGTEDRLGKALADLFENPLLNGALGRASDAREKAAQAQELAMGALNLPSAADIERLTRRLRSVSQRLEGIEDGVHRLGRNLSNPSIDARLTSIEEQLQTLSRKLDDKRAAVTRMATKRPAAKRSAAKGAALGGVGPGGSVAKGAAAKRSAAKGSAARSSTAKGSAAKRSKPAH
jgi:hypothetical protein